MRVDKADGKTTTTLYLGNYEIASINDGQKTIVQQKNYIGPNLLYVQTSGSKDNTYVLLKDNLGSTTDIVDVYGNIVQHFDYTPFGEQTQTKGDKPANPITHKGFTGHEEVEAFNLIHMGGRIYDPVIGRFLTADPTMQAPANPQDLNRYSYCLNNPLRFTDPNGFGIFDWVSDLISGICNVIKDVVNAVCDFVKNIFSARVLGMILSIVVNCIPGIGQVAMMFIQAALSAAVAAASGGDFASIIMAAGLSFVSAVAWGKVGDICTPLKAEGGWASNFAGNAKSCLLHGAVGGTLSAVEGGSFKDGFLGAAVGDACSGMVNSIEKDSTSHMAIMERSAAAGIVGGTAAVISGGNFIDGAKTAAFAQMFNDEAHKTMMDQMREKVAAARHATLDYLKEHGDVSANLAIPVAPYLDVSLGVDVTMEGCKFHAGVGPAIGGAFDFAGSANIAYGKEAEGFTQEVYAEAGVHVVGAGISWYHSSSGFGEEIKAGYIQGVVVGVDFGYTSRRFNWR
jgi:RHS repeat-associated protein